MLPTNSQLLGPFIGNVTKDAATIWLQIPNLTKDESRTVYVTLHQGDVTAQILRAGEIEANYNDLNVGIVRFEGLNPDTVYFYKLWEDLQHSASLDTNGLTPNDLYFRTLTASGFDDQLDFLLLSCHNPTMSRNDGADGFAVWARMPDIINENKNVRFAILAGDQIYADEVELRAQKEKDLRKRQELYLGIYKEFWDNVHYRRVLCSLPAYLMWDDHDITDGWGSRVDSFRRDHHDQFKEDWLRMFEAARSTFKEMQASRNPEPLPQDEANKSFDFCFRVGRAGFVVPDLRSNRNVRVPRIMLPEQLEAIRTWVETNRQNIDVLFFVSSVVFSHEAPQVTGFLLRIWFLVMIFIAWLKKLRLLSVFRRRFNKNIGDLRDDINDSWGADVNRAEADRVLDFLFDMQNPPNPKEAINVIILSGDIHTPGYSTLYSADVRHVRKAVIPHIVASPVSYTPLSWIAEAVFRHLTITVSLGNKGMYTAQISHHFSYRNAVILSLRKFPGAKADEPEMQLKVKYYLEYFPEPQIMLFDLNRSSHREHIAWPVTQAKHS